MSWYVVREDRFIPVDAQTLFDIVADPAQHPVLDGSGSVRQSDPGNPSRLFRGARFSMGMKIGASYQMANEVTEFEEGVRIGWQPASGHTWRYIFHPVQAGTVVTEEWDARHGRVRLLPVLAGFRSRNRRGIRATLQRLERHAVPGADHHPGASGTEPS